MPPDRESPRLGPFAWPAAVLVGWSGICLLWSPSPDGTKQGAIYLLFYMLPLGLIAAVLARAPWRLDSAKVLYILLAAMALVFGLIGIEQYLTRNIYWNPKVKVDNAFAPVDWFYRVNSVFYDPSIYGRFLVVGILASVTLVLFARGYAAWAAAGLAAVTTIGLLPSFSQSSYFALAVGIAAALIVLWRRAAILPLALAAAVLAAVTLGVPQFRHRILGKAGLSHATGGRSTLVSTGRPPLPEPSADRGGDRWLRHGVCEGDAQAGPRIAHRAAHRRGGDRRRRARCALLAARVRLRRPVPRQPRQDTDRPRPARIRISLDRDRRAQLLLQRPDRGPALLGPDRPVRRRAARAGGRARMIGGWKRALVLAPHTDDGEFGCGGTMARLVEEGADVRYVAFSIATRSLPEGFPPDTLRHEVAAATSELGIPGENLTVHDFDVRTFPDHRQEILELLIQLWNDWQPDVVFQPSLHDIHQDHQTIATEGLRAFKRTTILGYEIPWNNLDFAYQAYISLERRHVDLKVAALDRYASQQHRRYADPEYVRSLARIHGINVNREHAEVFQVYRAIA